MLEIRPERRAESDIRDIYFRSVNIFGLRQAERYLSGLLHRIEQLRHNPEIGIRLDGFDGAVRCLLYRNHKVYYRHDKTTVHIIRILDARRDTRRHL